MIASEVIEALEKYALSNTMVMLAKDEEGNSFSTLFAITTKLFVPNQYHYDWGDFVDPEYDKIPKNAEIVLVFWPTG